MNPVMADSDFGGLNRSEMVKRSGKLHRLGLGLTALWIGGSGIYALCVIDLMWAMKPDEFATFLSGVFAPVAFLWLVLGFMQQGDELRNSAEALRLQGEELRNSVEQQRQLVEVSREQMKFEAEARAMSESDADRAAQPVLTLSGNINARSGDKRSGVLVLRSVGPTCTDVAVHVSDGRKFTRSILLDREVLELNLDYNHPEKISPLRIKVDYSDLRSQRRRVEFVLPVAADPSMGFKFAPPSRKGPFPIDQA